MTSPTATRIFVVEDEAIVALELKDHLRTMGYEVCGHAARGASALAQIPTAAPDLVLIDINLRTGFSGVEVAVRLRELLDVPVIFLTAYSDTDLIERVRRIRSYAYIVKPYDSRILRVNIEMALSRHQAAVALRDSDAFTTSVLDSLSAEVVVLDTSGVIVAVNAAWSRFGQANGGVMGGIGTDYLEVCRRGLGRPDGSDALAALDGIESVIRGAQEDFRMEYACHSPDERRWFSMRVSPLRGPRPGVVLSHENITTRRVAEQALLESERRYRRLFDESAEARYEVAVDGTVVRANRSLARLLGVASSEQLIGRNLSELFEDSGRRGVNAAEPRGATEAAHEEVPCLVRGESHVPVALSGAFVRDERGEVAGYHGTARQATSVSAIRDDCPG